MPALNRNEKVVCDNCGKQYVRQQAARHKKSCQGGTLSCPKCPNYFTKSQAELSYHIAKKHGPSTPKLSTTCTLCWEEFPSYYSLQRHKRTQHQIGSQIGGGPADLSTVMGDLDDDQLREELTACQHFLSDSEMENGRHNVYNFRLAELDSQIINANLEKVFESLKCAAKINIALGFVLRNQENGQYRYFYAHENNTLFEKSHLLCTRGDLTTIQDKVDHCDLLEMCARERTNTKWKFCLLTNVTIFAALLKNIPMGCKDAVLPEPLLRNCSVNCLMSNGHGPYNDNLCLFRALAVHLHGPNRIEEEAKKIFNDYLTKSGLNPSNFLGVSLDSLPIIEDIVQLNIFIYDIDIEDGDFIGELARRSVEKFDNSVKLLRYNNHICYVNDINAFFKCFRCSTCDKFFKHSGHFNRHVTSCDGRVKQIYPKSVYQLRETLFDKLDNFGIQYTDDQKLFKHFAIFDFESICVPDSKLKPTETTIWIGKHEPISVSISSNLLDEPIFICIENPTELVIAFVDALEKLADKSKLIMNEKFQNITLTVNTRLAAIFEKLNGRNKKKSRVFEYEDECVEDDSEENDASTQFLLTQKNMLLDLKQHLENYLDTLPVFGFNSSKYDINLIKSYLIPYLVNVRDIEPMVIKKANQFVSFKFGSIQLLDIMNFLGGATSLDSFLKAYKTTETKGFFPYEWFDCPKKLLNTELPAYNDFFSKLRNNNPLESDYAPYGKLIESGMTSEQAMKQLRLDSIPPTGADNYQYLIDTWKSQKMETFLDFLRWYNNKDVVPTLEAMTKMVNFYHEKGIDMLKLGCTLPNLANICLHSSTNTKFYPFTEADKDLLQKIRDDMTGGPSIVFTRKAVVGETYIRDSANVCKTIVGIDASQLYPYSMCQPMPSGLYTRWEFDQDLQRFKPRQNKSRKFENMVMSYFQSIRPDCNIQSFHTTGKQKKIDCFSVDGYCDHCKTVFEAMGCYFHHCPCQETRASLSDTDIQRGLKRREHDELRRAYLMEKGYKIEEIWECQWWEQFKTNENLKLHIRNNFPYQRPLTQNMLLQRITEEKLFGYVQCDLEVPLHLRDKFANFPPIFKNCHVGRDDIGNLMKAYAEEHELLKNPQRMLISSFKLQNGTIITPLLNFYLKLGLVCTKIYRFVQYTPKKCFNNFVQSVVDARRAGDENPASGVVAETMKLLGNSSYGYQIMDRSKHSITKYLCDEKTHKAINGKRFTRLNTINDNLYEVELAKKEIEHREPIIVGFFILQYAKLRMLELYYNFFAKYCDVNKFEELEMDTDSLYLALAEKEVEDCVLPEKRDEWDLMRANDCNDEFRADALNNFFPRTCCCIHKKHDKREPGLFKEEFRCTEMICLCSKTYCCYDKTMNKYKFSSKGLNKRTLEDSGDGPMPKYQKVMDEKVNEKSTNRGFRTINHVVATYEQTKKGLSYFYPKRKVQTDGIHTVPLNL